MPSFTLPLVGYPVVRLTVEHAPELQDLYERCTDYHQLHEGSPTCANAGLEELTALPPGRSAQDKLPFGIYSPEEELVGYLELFRNYPGEGEWWIGLLMLDPKVRNAGLGSAIYHCASAWAAENGARRILLGVLEEESAAERFWRRQGFEELRRQPYTSRTEAQHHTLILIRHELGVGKPA